MKCIFYFSHLCPRPQLSSETQPNFGFIQSHWLNISSGTKLRPNYMYTNVYFYYDCPFLSSNGQNKLRQSKFGYDDNFTKKSEILILK
jgi:hypothetical protein